MTDSAGNLPRAVAGDRDALAALLAEVAVPIHAELQREIGPRWNGQLEADDVMQVTYLEAFLRIHAFAPVDLDGFRAWVRRIALNNLQDAVRELSREKRRPKGRRIALGSTGESALDLAELMQSPATASSVVSLEESKQLLDAALKQLPPDYERVLRLCDLEGQTGAQAAAAMGRSHGAIKMLIARARERLREMLGTQSRYL